MILKILGAIIGVIGGSVLLNGPQRTLPYAGLIGGIGWAIYLLSLNLASAVLSTFIAGLVIVALSHIFARLKKVPVTIFLIPAFLPFFPGLDIYRAVSSFMQDSPNAGDYTRSTFQIAGMIALSIFIVDSLLKSFDSK